MNEIHCEIRTPQHIEGGEYWINQTGMFNTKTFEFHPDKGQEKGHKVWFHSMDNFLEFMVRQISADKKG